jgi:hypothetical protein
MLAFSSNTSAQIPGRYLEKKMKQAVNRAGQKADEEVTEEMNKKVDEGVEKVFDDIFDEDEEPATDKPSSSGEENEKSSSSGSPGSDAAAKAMMKSLGITTAPTNVEETYQYAGNIFMTVQSWNDDGSTDGEVNYTTYMTNDNSGFAMEFEKDGQNSLMIFDYGNGSMIILSENENEKTGIVTPYASYLTDSLEEVESDPDSEEIDDFSVYNQNLKKTGKSKKIAGYSCDEYTYEDEESDITLWMTDELPAELWANMYSANVITASAAGNYGGFVMEMDQKDKTSEDRVFLQVQEVNRNESKSFSTKGYQLISFGGNTSQ